MEEPKVCANCRHIWMCANGWECRNPVAVDIVSGRFVKARKARATSGACKPAGKLYEAKAEA